MKESKFLMNLLKEKDIIVFACSGGPDSMCLLDLLRRIKQSKEILLICAHINHNKRKESEEEYLFVKEYCEKNGIIFEGTKFQKYESGNFQAIAHHKRQDFFNQIINKYHANYFMTAHHGDDLMETILMRLTRGSSIKGYAGFNKIEYYENYTLVRPLITATKKEIEDYDIQHNIPFVKDKSNDCDDYTRNRYRHIVLPFLKQENKNVHLKFLAFHDKLLEINEFLVKIVSNALTDCIQNDNLHIDEWKKLDSLIQREVLKAYFNQELKDDIEWIHDVHIAKTIQLLKNQKSNTRISLPSGYIGIKNYQIFKIRKKNIKENFFIKLDGNCILETGVIKKEETNEKSNFVIRLLSSEIKLPLYIRNRKKEDKIAAKNLNGHQKIKDIFINHKIPLEQRDTWPILVDANDEILWIPGLKKSKFDKEIYEKYDIIYKYVFSKEKDYVTKK